MIAPGSALSVTRQAKRLSLSRSSVYHGPRPGSQEELDLLKRLDERFTENPMYGSRRLQVMLKREGVLVGRRRIRRLMKKPTAPSTVDLWTAGGAGARLALRASCGRPVENAMKRCVSHRPPTGRRLPTSSTAPKLQSFKSGKVKTISPASTLAYSTPVAVQATVTTAPVEADDGRQVDHFRILS